MARAGRTEVQPRDDSDEEDAFVGENTSSASQESGLSDDDADPDDDADDTQSSVESESVVKEGEEEALKDISFGALAEAQARLNPNPRKRKLKDRDTNDIKVGNETKTTELPDNQKWKYDPASREKEKRISRSSKHAPTIMSSRNPVTRKREIFSPPPAAKFRDPRFDAAVTAESRRGNTSSTQYSSRAYSFLTDYQAKEVLDMKSQMKKIQDPDQQADLKRQIMSTEAKVRNAEVQRREAEILQEHKRKEREAIKDGKKTKAYYLKPSEVKKQIFQERRDAMGSKARDKSDKRKKMREKTKEARDMPWARRQAV